MKSKIQIVHHLVAPCSNALCIRCQGAATRSSSTHTREIFAHLRYELGWEIVTEKLVVTVPADYTYPQWRAALECATDRLLRPLGADFGSLNYRLDGTDQPLTWREWTADRWHHFTWRGTAVTEWMFVPIWPGQMFLRAH